MLWFVDSQHPAPWQLEVSEASPAEVVDGPFENDSFALEVGHRGLQVVAHEVELVAGFGVGVEGDLCRGQGEDQPAVTGVDRVEIEDVLEEVAVGFGVLAVDDDVGSGYHVEEFRRWVTDWEEGVGGGVWVVF
jgi:hypothetical protein